jgi:GT2 family glycosyltransferase
MENDDLKFKMIKKAAIILVNYRDYADRYLEDCLAGLRKQDYTGEMKIFITDNASTAESYDYLKRAAPEAEIIRNTGNDGFAKGNNDAIKRALAQGFDYVVLFNMDTVVADDCVRKLAEAAERLAGGKEIGAVQARLMLFNDQSKINSLGNVTHFLGFGYAEGYKEKITNDQCQITKEICYPSGAAVLFTKEALEKVGLFDEEFWMYNEDQDLGWRLWLTGYRCVLAPEAVVYHKYEFSRSIKKYYWLDRNRLLAILKNYHWLTLLLVAPALAAMEIGLVLFAVSGGWFREKVRVYQYFFSLKNWRYLAAARQQAQSLRRVRDRDIVRLFSGRIWYQEIGEWRLRVANAVFNAYWQVVKVLIRW